MPPKKLCLCRVFLSPKLCLQNSAASSDNSAVSTENVAAYILAPIINLVRILESYKIRLIKLILFYYILVSKKFIIVYNIDILKTYIYKHIFFPNILSSY